MKKIIFAALTLSIMISACSKKLDEINENPKGTTEANGTYLFSNAQKELTDNLASTNQNLNVFRLFAQNWTQTTYFDESRYLIKTRSVDQNFWTELYRDVLMNFKQAKISINKELALTPDEKDVQTCKVATIDIMEVYTWQIMVDLFGNIPYSQALDANQLQPKYDDAATIYADLLSRLTTDITTLQASAGGLSFADGDLYYGGDNAMWVKFAATLKIKIGTHLMDVNPTLGTQAITEGLPDMMTSSADDATFHYLSSQPNTNPLWVDLVSTGRRDFVAANTMIDYLDSLSDPRMYKYFTWNKDSIYVGGTYGDANGYGINSKVSPTLKDPTFAHKILTYTELEFLLAELAERGVAVGGTAASHYNAGVNASMGEWGVIATDAASYLAQADVDYATAPGTWKEKIGMQSWLAMYNRGFESWTNWRRLDAPLFNAPPSLTYSDIPKRFTYPDNESNLNGSNYNAAASTIGGDMQSTRIFWDLN
jgi:hypothetical protein